MSSTHLLPHQSRHTACHIYTAQPQKSTFPFYCTTSQGSPSQSLPNPAPPPEMTSPARYSTFLLITPLRLRTPHLRKLERRLGCAVQSRCPNAGRLSLTCESSAHQALKPPNRKGQRLDPTENSSLHDVYIHDIYHQSRQIAVNMTKRKHP